MKDFAGILRGRKVAVLMGGPGSEREVSLRSGAAVLGALRAVGAEAEGVDVRGADFSLPEGCELAFNMVHGTFGEDGGIQTVLERLGVPYTGEGITGSRTAFDKIATKRRFDAANIPTAPWHVLRTGESPKMPPPFVVKAPRQGSSVGVHIVGEAAEAGAAIADCLAYDTELLIETFTPGRELTVGVLGDRALPVIEIVPSQGFYDYKNKYTKGATEYFVPAEIGAAATGSVRETALAAHRALGLEVYSRVDILLCPDASMNVMEINTIPGMTETILLPKAAAAEGIGFPELCECIAQLSLQRFPSPEGGRKP
jgi:D-alanine-D-alanine ligase